MTGNSPEKDIAESLVTSAYPAVDHTRLVKWPDAPVALVRRERRRAKRRGIEGRR